MILLPPLLLLLPPRCHLLPHPCLCYLDCAAIKIVSVLGVGVLEVIIIIIAVAVAAVGVGVAAVKASAYSKTHLGHCLAIPGEQVWMLVWTPHLCLLMRVMRRKCAQFL